MCGINGIVKKGPMDLGLLQQQLTQMNNRIIHRGPDDDGEFIYNSPNYTIGMAMRRLAIIDLNTGKQPMYSEDKSITIVFNGEIYNYQALKNNLESEGITFKTQSDTEVVLKLYEQYGSDQLSQLDGMFAFSIYDSNRNRLIVARDYFGEKPLYFYKNDDTFIWASELKSLVHVLGFKPDLCSEGLNLFFRLTYIPAPFTIYRQVKKVEANSILTLDLNAFELVQKDLHSIVKPEKLKITFEQAKKQIKTKVYDSIESRSISDVPIGTLLSGGVDSSIVSLCLAQQKELPIDTFSIGFEKKSYDETDKSRTVSKMIQSKHHEFIIGEKDFTNNMDAILLNFDEPFADSACLATHLVAHKTQSFVKVALTGDGGDEVFGGYNKYYIGKINSKFTKIVPQRIHKSLLEISNNFLTTKGDSRGVKYKLNKVLSSISYKDSYYWDIISLGFNASETSTLLKNKFQFDDIFKYYKLKTQIEFPRSLNDFQNIDKVISLEGDMLVKADRTSMFNSLECRSPFLNKSLYDYAMRLPESYLLNKWSKKHILKEAFKTEFPKGFLEKQKQGLGVPVGDWLREGLKDELLSYCDVQFLESQNIFNVSETLELINNHLNNTSDKTFQVWCFFCFQKWYTQTYQNLKVVKKISVLI